MADLETSTGWMRFTRVVGALFTRAETWILTLVVGMEISVICTWVVLRAFATPVESESGAGWVIRAAVGAVALGLVARLGARRLPEATRSGVTLAAAGVGAMLADHWIGWGVPYASNLLNWVQQSSTMTLFGGLLGVATRLTLVLALLGASLAAGGGKHITIDVVTRVLPAHWRRRLEAVSWLVAAGVCLSVGWGFFDHIAVQSFGAAPDVTALEKAKIVTDGVGEHAFIFRQQLSLDAASFGPIVIEARPYADWFDGAAWNRWLEDHGMIERYGAEAVDALRVAETETRAPVVTIPGLGEPRGELTASANLIFPLGLWLLGFRLAHRALSGLLGVELSEASEWDIAGAITHEGSSR